MFFISNVQTCRLLHIVGFCNFIAGTELFSVRFRHIFRSCVC